MDKVAMEITVTQLTLPSGSRATLSAVGKLKGRDLIKAQRAIAPSDMSLPMATAFALLAPRVRLDGRQLVYEDMLEMDLADVNALMEADANLGTPATGTLSPRSSAS